MRPALADGLPLAPDGSGDISIGAYCNCIRDMDACASCYAGRQPASYQLLESQPAFAGTACADVHVRRSTPLFSASVNTSPFATTVEVSV